MSAAKHTLTTSLTAVTENAVFRVLLNIYFSAERQRTVDVFSWKPVPLFDCPVMFSWSHLWVQGAATLGWRDSMPHKCNSGKWRRRKRARQDKKGAKEWQKYAQKHSWTRRSSAFCRKLKCCCRKLKNAWLIEDESGSTQLIFMHGTSAETFSSVIYITVYRSGKLLRRNGAPVSKLTLMTSPPVRESFNNRTGKWMKKGLIFCAQNLELHLGIPFSVWSLRFFFF